MSVKSWFDDHWNHSWVFLQVAVEAETTLTGNLSEIWQKPLSSEKRNNGFRGKDLKNDCGKLQQTAMEWILGFSVWSLHILPVRVCIPFFLTSKDVSDRLTDDSKLAICVNVRVDGWMTGGPHLLPCDGWKTPPWLWKWKDGSSLACKSEWKA